MPYFYDEYSVYIKKSIDLNILKINNVNLAYLQWACSIITSWIKKNILKMLSYFITFFVFDDGF